MPGEGLENRKCYSPARKAAMTMTRMMLMKGARSNGRRMGEAEKLPIGCVRLW